MLFCLKNSCILSQVCRDAAMMGIRRAIKGLKPDEIKALPRDELHKPVTRADLEEAIKKVNKSVGKQDIERYEKWMNDFGSV